MRRRQGDIDITANLDSFSRKLELAGAEAALAGFDAAKTAVDQEAKIVKLKAENDRLQELINAVIKQFDTLSDALESAEAKTATTSFSAAELEVQVAVLKAETANLKAKLGTATNVEQEKVSFATTQASLWKKQQPVSKTEATESTVHAAPAA